jgi:hypothetical protein
MLVYVEHPLRLARNLSVRHASNRHVSAMAHGRNHPMDGFAVCR